MCLLASLCKIALLYNLHRGTASVYVKVVDFMLPGSRKIFDGFIQKAPYTNKLFITRHTLSLFLS